MKTKKLSIYQRLLFKYRQWRSNRNRKILDKIVCYTSDEAINLANQKRDITNHKAWVIPGSGEFIVFCRYQKANLQQNDILKKTLTFKELDEKASYIAMPVSEQNRKRGGILKKYKDENGNIIPHNKIIVPR